jgi:D-alanyl-D-alanine carboxypeptidase (penicillin-binding protein 5/6)
VLIDARTGQVLYDRNAYLEWSPASTTKIMTALVALERASLDTPIEISPAVARFREGSTVGLPAHVQIPLRDLLYALLLSSGNDVALAVAEGVGGTVPEFVAQMNERAAEMGTFQTHFTSPHGLYDPEHYSTAYDLALIAKVAMQNPTFREIVHTRQRTFTLPGRRARVLVNHNRLLTRFPGADGVKTGYVHKSGHTFVASATRNGWRLIAVILQSRDLWGDASRLLTYGYTHYRSTLLASAGEPLLIEKVPGTDRPLIGVAPQTIYGTVALGETVERRVRPDGRSTLPVHRGTRVGVVSFYVSGRLLRSAPLVAASDVTPGRLAEIISWVSHVVARISPAPNF